MKEQELEFAKVRRDKWRYSSLFMLLIWILFSVQTRQQQVIDFFNWEDYDHSFNETVVKPVPPIIEEVVKKQEIPVPMPDPTKKAVVTKPIPTAVMAYYKELDGKLVTLTNAFKNITNPYFADNVLDPRHEVFGIDGFRTTMNEVQVKNRFLKMLRISSYLQQPTIGAMK